MPKSSPNLNGMALAAIILGTLLGPLDSSVNIALPDITARLAIDVQAVRWLIIPYVATYGCLMLVFGRLGDLFGHARVFRIGLIFNMAAYALCGSAPSYEWLVAFRVFQGAGSAMVLSCGPALITGLFDESIRPRLLGAYAMTYGLGTALGPSLGGVMVDAWGWPAVFWFRFPIALLAFLLLAGHTPPELPRDRRAAGLMGIVGDTARNPDFIIVNTTNIAVNFTAFSVMLLVPYFLTQPHAPGVAFGGAIMATGPLIMMIAAQSGGYLAPVCGANRLAFLGALGVAGGILAVSFWPADVAVPWMLASLGLYGAGWGLFQAASFEMVSAVLPRSQRGVAGSLVLVMRMFGVVFGAYFLMHVFTNSIGGSYMQGQAGDFLSAFQTTFKFAGLTLLGFLALTCLRPSVWWRKW